MALLETMHIEGQDYTFQQLRHLFARAAALVQEGVFAAGDYTVAQRAAGANMSVDVAAGDAWVQGDTGTRNGLYLQTNDGVVNVPVTAANGSNPRIDQVVLQINDSNVIGGSNTPELKVIAGTPTAGATLDNRLGAASLGNDRVRLADVLVPTSSTTVTTANIRDRRPWCRGAFRRILRNANAAAGADYASATSATPALIDATNLAPRIECSGCPMRATLRGRTKSAVINSGLELRVDAAAIDGGHTPTFNTATAHNTDALELTWLFVPAAGSHIIAPYFHGSGSSNMALYAGAATPLEFVVEELVRQDAANG